MIAAQKYKKPTVRDYHSVMMVNVKSDRYDPTRTLTLRRAFMRDVNKRIIELKAAIRKAIVEDDVFGLKPPLPIYQLTTPGREAYAFATSEQKVNEFMTWLNQQEQKGLLQTSRAAQLGGAIETPWTNVYITDAYKRGVQRATYELAEAPSLTREGVDAAMGLPMHVDRVGVLYARTFTDLKGITAAMDAQISQVLAQGLIQGDGPALLAKKITERVDKIGRTRALTLARTEVIRAHHQGIVQEYRNWGLEGVRVQAEWKTAGFGVCPECEEKDGKVFSLDQIESMIPLHPNCRCIALPVKAGEEKTEVKKPEPEPKRVTSLTDADRLIKEMNLTKAQREALLDYTGGQFNQINGFYRGLRSEITDSAKKSAELLDDIIKRAPKIEYESYRGLNLPESTFNEFAKLKKNDPFIDKGFVSSTTDKSIIRNFTGSGQYQVEMTLKGKNGVLIQSFSDAPGEKEILFGRSSKWLVDSIKIKKNSFSGKILVTLSEIVP